MPYKYKHGFKSCRQKHPPLKRKTQINTPVHLPFMEKDVNFMTTVAKLKVENGLTSYVLGNKYLMTSFNKVHAINASDKISINIYEIDSISYICEFIIDKKKYKVKEYIRYRYMK